MKMQHTGMGKYAHLIFAYALCLITIVAFAGIGTYMHAVRSYNEEFLELNRGAINQYAEILQSKVITPIEDAAYAFASSSSNQTYIFGFFYNDTFSLSDTHKLRNLLNELSLSNINSYYDISLYNINRQTLLSQTIGLYLIDDHKSSIHYKTDWLDLLSNGRKGWFGPLVFDFPGSPDYQIMYSLPYPIGAPTASIRGYLNFCIDEKQVRNILSSLFAEDDEELFIIDSAGRIVSSTNTVHIDALCADLGLTDISQGNVAGIKTIKEHNEYITLCYSAPLTNGWRIVRKVAATVFYSSSRSMQNGMLILNACALLIGTLLAFFFSRKIYKPIQTLTHTLGADDTSNTSFQSGVINEYAFIDSAIQNMHAEIEKMRDQLEDSSTITKNYLIFSLLNGTLSSREDFKLRLNQLGYADKSRHCTALQINLSAAMINAPDPTQVNLIKLNILSRLEELSRENRLVLACEIKNNELAAIVLSDTAEESDIFETLGLHFLEQYARHIEIIVGKWQDSPLKLNLSYQSAQEAQRYHFFHPDWLYCSYDMIATPELDTTRLSALEQSFVNAVQNQSRDDAIDALHLLSYEEQDHIYSFDIASTPLTAMANALCEASQTEDAHSACLRFIEKNNSRLFKNIREYANEMCRLLYDILDVPSAQAEDEKHSHVIEQLIAYINQNLHTDLSLTLLANYANLSSSYLSRLFKKETGETIVEFITTQRLELARQLLEQTDQSIEMITQQVGYPTHHYFSKKFKERFDTTPKDYRQEFRLKRQH